MTDIEITIKPVDMDVEAIMKYLPHRAPMLMLDRVTGYSDTEIHAQKFVPSDAHYFQGHFPENPMMPGVMIVEAVAQAGALLAALNDKFDTNTHLLAFAGIDKAKFKRTVYPNETLCVFVKMVKQRSILYKFEGIATVNDSVVALVNFSATQVPKRP